MTRDERQMFDGRTIGTSPDGAPGDARRSDRMRPVGGIGDWGTLEGIVQGVDAAGPVEDLEIRLADFEGRMPRMSQRELVSPSNNDAATNTAQDLVHYDQSDFYEQRDLNRREIANRQRLKKAGLLGLGD